MTTWVETHGRTPKTGERLLRVIFANGAESRHEYTAKQLIWKQRGWDFDITHVRRV